MSSNGGMVTGMTMRSVSPFTVSQRQELEHQALIFKYLMAGLPIPPDLLFSVHNSFESMSARFFQHPTMGYCSYYGKKVDPEPGRCKRTDGKKWRCSKDAYLDSKYCERHMHRGRNRSRKLVESQTISPSSSTITSLPPTGGSSSDGGTTKFQNLTLQAFGNNPSFGINNDGGANQVAHYNMDSNIPFGIPSNKYHLQGMKQDDVGDHSFFSEASETNPLENTWSMLPSRVSSSFPSSKSSDNDYLRQQLFFSSEFALEESSVKQEGQSLRPFFDEGPKARDSWSGLEEERSNQTSVSATSSRSPHDN